MSYLLHHAFQQSSDKYPHKIAIAQENGREISYQDLSVLADKFANFFSFIKEDVGSSPYIGVLSPVHIHSIAAVLGILKAGGVYVPLDEYSPTERLEHILNNTQMDTVVVDPSWYEHHIALFKNTRLKKIVFLDIENHYFQDIGAQIYRFDNITNLPVQKEKSVNQVSDDLAYILHTSGSTGVPKGIMLTHRNAHTFVNWMQKEFQLTPDDIVMSRAPFKFDLSVFDIFNTFYAGAKLICFDWLKERSSEQKHVDYVKLMENKNATILYSTPSTFITLMNRGNLGENSLSLRQIMYAGEPFPTAQLRRLKNKLSTTRIANIYGPTETNIITYYWVDKLPADDCQPIPLGNVVDDTEILIIDEKNKRICASNEIGELWCRGGTVTLGYLGLPEKNKESLVDSPFHKYPAKFWRTGDFGFRDENGLLHYRGRQDHMVKVKGFRIELGEIETALAQLPELDEFVCVALPDEKYGNRIYCIFSVLANSSLTPDKIIVFLKQKLPDYMIPYQFYQKETLPKTSSGKIDRIALIEETKMFLNKAIF